jgi:hypothetical protein
MFSEDVENSHTLVFIIILETSGMDRAAWFIEFNWVEA